MACVCGAQDGALGATALLFVLYGPASAGFSYFTSFLFKEHSSGQSFILMSNVFSIILVLASFVLGFIDSYVTRCAGVPQPQHHALTCIAPSMCVAGCGLYVQHERRGRQSALDLPVPTWILPGRGAGGACDAHRAEVRVPGPQQHGTPLGYDWQAAAVPGHARSVAHLRRYGGGFRAEQPVVAGEGVEGSSRARGDAR